MIDLSDGLGSDAAIVARASAVALEIDLAALPLAAGVPDVALAVGGGEDYELCLCAAAEDRSRIEAAVPAVTWIGRVAEGRGARFRGAGRRAHAARLRAPARLSARRGVQRLSAAAPTRCRRASPGRRS